MFGVCISLGLPTVWDRLCALAYLNISQKMSPAFYQTYRTGDLMAHATNDINALTRLAGGGVMSAVDASITALVTLMTMLFSISWQMTLVAILPLPFMAYATSRLGRKTHKAFGESQAAFSELNNKVQESVSGIKVTKSFGYQADELKSFQEVNELTFQKNLQTMKYDSLFDPMVLLFVGSSYVLTLLVGSLMVQKGRLRLEIWLPLSAIWICWFGLLWLLVSSLISLSEGRFPTSGLKNCCLRNHLYKT